MPDDRLIVRPFYFRYIDENGRSHIAEHHLHNSCSEPPNGFMRIRGEEYLKQQADERKKNPDAKLRRIELTTKAEYDAQRFGHVTSSA